MAHVHHLPLFTPAADLTPGSTSASHNEATTRMKLRMTRTRRSGWSAAGQSSGLSQKVFWLDEVWAPSNQRAANDRRGKSITGRKTCRAPLATVCQKPLSDGKISRKENLMLVPCLLGAYKTKTCIPVQCTSRGVSRQRRESRLDLSKATTTRKDDLMLK